MKVLSRSGLICQLLKSWLPLAFIVTAMSLLIYAAAQQVLRQSANDPQMQMAQDTATELASGQSPEFLVTPQVDVQKSLAPFLIIYDQNGKAITSGANLHGQTPQLPDGVLAYAAKHTQDRFTWQPTSGVRIAAVVIKYQTANRAGYVLAGRSLEEIEVRESDLLWLVAAGWVVTLTGSLMLVGLIELIPLKP